MRLLYKLRLLFAHKQKMILKQQKFQDFLDSVSLKKFEDNFQFDSSLGFGQAPMFYDTLPYWKFLGVLFQVPNATLIHVIHVSEIFHSV